jgi:hypothetical protein
MEITLADDLVRFIFVYHQFDHGERTPKNMCFGVEVVLAQQPDHYGFSNSELAN